jgi:hypothetical protein
MALVRTFTLPHYEKYPVHVVLFKNVKNAGYLRSQLMEANPDFDYAFLDAEMVSARLTLSMSIIFKSFPIRVHVLGLSCIITPRQTASFSFATVPCCRCITIPSFKFPPSIIFTFLFDASPVMQPSVHPHPQIHYDHYIPFPPSTLQPSTSSSRSILTTNPLHSLFPS